MGELLLLVAFGVSVATLIVLITRYAVSPFVALLLATVILAGFARLEMSAAWDHFAQGVGSVLSSTAMIIGLGAMIGMLLQRSGGAAALANGLVDLLGPKRLGWTMWIVGCLVGIGVWFTVGLVLLVPIVVALARVAQVRLLVPAMSMLAGLSAMHGLAPPHPGPLVAITLVGADTGRTILWSLIVGATSAAIAGPLFWRWFDRRMEMPLIERQRGEAIEETAPPRGFFAPLVVILLPILLMLVGSFAAGDAAGGAAGDAGQTRWPEWLAEPLVSLGNPIMAMLVGLVLAYVTLGWQRGFSRQAIGEMTQESLFPVANVLLVVGAGAGYSRVLIASGVGDVLASLVGAIPLPTLVLAWLIAAAFRVATGSATTAITAAGGIVSVMLDGNATVDRDLVVLALGAGSLTLSHVNDGGFWFVKEFFGLTVPQTLKTWTVLETVLSLVALAIVVLVDQVV